MISIENFKGSRTTSSFATFENQYVSSRSTIAQDDWSKQKSPISSSQVFSLSPVVGGRTRSQLDSEAFTSAKALCKHRAQELAREWKRLLLTPQANIDADALTETVDPLFESISQFGSGAIDLRNLPVEQVNGVHLAVILRVTLSTREQTLGWDAALEVARQALTRDGLDVDGALIGLI